MQYIGNVPAQATSGTVTIADGSATLVKLDRTGAAGQVLTANGPGVAPSWATVGGLPSGVIVPFGGTLEPVGWMFCYGQAISRTTYPSLFATIGTTYGNGDGSTTFNLPDLRGRVVAGQDDMGGTSANRLTNQPGGLDGDTLGAAGGTETVTLSTAQMPAHQHLLANNSDVSSGVTTLTASNYINRRTGYSTNDNYHLGGSATVPSIGLSGSTGSGAAHNNVQPTFVLNYIIKT